MTKGPGLSARSCMKGSCAAIAFDYDLALDGMLILSTLSGAGLNCL